MDASIERGIELIRGAEHILVFSGAGLSTESGIPDFRSPGGLWSKYDPSEFYFDRFLAEERARATYWKMSTESYHIMKDARPNRAHLAVKTLETMGKLLAVVTQNIDRLHHKAGNSPDRIIEIHGTLFSVSCLSCGKTYDRDDIDDRITSGVDVPTCDDCGGILKPDTISFGQAMPEDKMAKSFTLARESDLCMALGSSLVVYPAASIPSVALQSGAKLMIINRDETPLDPEADVVVHGSLSEVLGDMVQASK